MTSCEHFLTDKQKTAYQQLRYDRGFPQVSVSLVTCAQWVLNVFMMVLHYSADRCADITFAGKAYIDGLQAGNDSPCLVLFVFCLLPLPFRIGLQLAARYGDFRQGSTSQVVFSACQGLAATFAIWVCTVIYWLRVYGLVLGLDFMNTGMWIKCIHD